MEIEIDVNKDILKFDPVPPKKVLLDYIPNFLVHPLRRFFGWPGPTPLEHWHLSLVFVRKALDELVAEYKQTRLMKVQEFGYDPQKEYKPAGGRWN